MSIYALPVHMASVKNLTQEQVDALPDGSVVYVCWSGGNGWHRYTIKKDVELGGVFAMLPADDEFDSFPYWRQLKNVGDHPLTQVKLDYSWRPTTHE